MRPTNQGEILAALSLCTHLQQKYWSGCGADEFVVDFLTHLRHFCDERNLDFGSLDRRAYQLYLGEKTLNGNSQAPERGTPILHLHAPANAFTPCANGRHWLQARVNADGVMHSLWAISVKGGLGQPSVAMEDLSHILSGVRALTSGKGRLRTVSLYGDEYVLLLVPSKEP